MDVRRFVASLLLLAACKAKPPDPAYTADAPLDVVLVPGCPSQPDGTLSGCQWHRVGFAVQLWEDGVTEAFKEPAAWLK